MTWLHLIRHDDTSQTIINNISTKNSVSTSPKSSIAQARNVDLETHFHERTVKQCCHPQIPFAKNCGHMASSFFKIKRNTINTLAIRYH